MVVGSVECGAMGHVAECACHTLLHAIPGMSVLALLYCAVAIPQSVLRVWSSGMLCLCLLGAM